MQPAWQCSAAHAPHSAHTPWLLSDLDQIEGASQQPGASHIAAPAASWLDDFLSWASPEIPQCCRAHPDGSRCPPPDQPPCQDDAKVPAGWTPSHTDISQLLLSCQSRTRSTASCCGPLGHFLCIVSVLSKQITLS